MLYETCKHWFFYSIALIITSFSACEEGKCCKKSEVSLFSQRNFHFRCDKIIFSKKKTTSCHLPALILSVGIGNVVFLILFFIFIQHFSGAERDFKIQP